MSADPNEDSQLRDLKSDSSSSSSPGSGSPQYETVPKESFFSPPLSELNINDGKKVAEQTTSSSHAFPTSSSSDLNEENVLFSHSHGSQDQISSTIQITGGEFVGANFSPQTTNQTIFLEKLEQSQHIHHHHYYPAGSSQQGTSLEETIGATGYTPDQQEQQANTEEPSTSSEDVQLCSFIRMFPKCCISENIFHGEESSQTTGRRKLAIKFLRYKKERLKEAKILAKLHSHHNVVSIVHSDIFKFGLVEHIYIAMELCHEQNLHDHVIENINVPFDPQLIIFQAKQLVEGLNHIHSNDIIHRDLKPHNVLFTLDKKTLKIADFGISKEMTSGRTMTYVTNARAGTDGYRAPETYNMDVISKQTDIFSLGLVLYFLFSNGHHAFGDDPDDWNSNIKKNRNRDLSRLLLADTYTAIDLLEWTFRVNPRERPTATQTLRHQMFGGIEKDPAPISLETRPNEAQIKVKEESSYTYRRAPSLFQFTASEQEVPSSTQEIRACSSKRSGNPGEMRMLTEKAQRHMEDSEFSLASEALHNLLEYQTHPESRLETIQQLAECHVMSNVPLHEDIKQLLSTCESLRLSSEYFENMADDHFNQSHLVCAYIMYIFASKWYKAHSTPSDAVTAIERCIKKIRDVTLTLKQVGSHILSNCVKTDINEMLEDQATCFLDLGCTYNSAREYKIAQGYLVQGLKLMKNHFIDDVFKHKLCGHIWKNLIVCEGRLGEKGEAFFSYNNALTVFNKAEDYEEEDKRRKDIESTQQEYENLQKLFASAS